MDVGSAALPAFNHLLSRAEWARNKLIPFAGRRAVILLAPWRFEFQISHSGMFEAPGDAVSEAIDVEIALPAQAFLSVFHDPSDVMRTARISGSAEFAEALGFVLTRLRWDAEEDIARWIGDIPARRLSALVGKMADWQKQAAQRFGENLAEFLAEESAILAASSNTSHFVAAVDGLRDDVARLEKRIQRLA